MHNVAIIPARSGSKGIIDKNIRLLNGKPLMSYSIKAAIESEMFDEIMVSTDSEEYASIAKKSGAKVPFIRSADTSTDEASSWDVVREVLHNYQNIGMYFDTFALLQPTSPLRNSADIRNAYTEFTKRGAVTLTSVCESKYSPINCNLLPENLSMETFYMHDHGYLRRQDIDKYYHENGAIYIGNAAFILSNNEFYNQNCYAYIMSVEHSIDIDTELDFKYIEFLLHEGVVI